VAVHDNDECPSNEMQISMSKRKEKERDIFVAHINISEEIFLAFYRVSVHRANRAVNLFEEARILSDGR